MTRHFFLTGSVIALLSACGGGGGGSDSVSFAELLDRTDQLGLLDGDFLEDDETDFEAIPTTGSATYTGVATVSSFAEINDEPDEQDFVALGATTLTADFGDQSISGSADNFFQIDNVDAENLEDLTGERIDGSLEYELVQVEGGINFYEGSVSGSVSPTDAAEIDIDQTFAGFFTGEDADGFIAVANEPDTEVDADVLIVTTID